MLQLGVGGGLGYYGLIYCVTTSLHGKLLPGKGKGRIKAQEYIKDEGGGKKTPAKLYYDI